MNEELKSMAKEYIDKVNNVCLLLLKGLNLKAKEDLWKYRETHHDLEIYIGDGKYTYHGRGCKFSNKDFTIDWDFGYGSRWCGIEHWKLAYYIKENYKELIEFHDGFNIQKEFEQCIISGEVVKKYGLYYFKIPDSETFEPDFPKEFDTLIIDNYASQWIIKRNKMIDRFIRKSRRVYKNVGEGNDAYTLCFVNNEKIIFSIPFDDIGYPEKAVEIMFELLKVNIKQSK